MTMYSFDDLVEEIASCTDLSISEVRERIWMEALELGWNVGRDMRLCRATPHVFNDNMIKLYSQGDGFIFETMLVSTKPSRQKWTEQSLARIRLYATDRQIPLSALKILMMGDGSGSDSLCFAENGISVDYFDVPGSKTYDFAVRRFRKHGVLGGRVNLVSNYNECLNGTYDVVVSFEVLEHLPDPKTAVRDISRCLMENGIALITESFGVVDPSLPTHLQSNLRFCGQLPIMAHRSGLISTWMSAEPRNKPLEFRKTANPRSISLLRLLRNRLIVSFVVTGSFVRAKLWGKKVLSRLVLTSG